MREKCIESIQKKADKKGSKNIEAIASTAADLSFIPGNSVDFVLANGLLCSMEVDRPKAVNEIKRILNQKGYDYLSLGAAPPFGLVDADEWGSILSEFNLVDGGIFRELWAVVAF